MLAPRLGEDGGVHVLKAHGGAAVVEAGKDILGRVGAKAGVCRNRTPSGVVLDGQSGARVPVPPLPDGFGEDDLAFGGDRGGEGVGMTGTGGKTGVRYTLIGLGSSEGAELEAKTKLQKVMRPRQILHLVCW